MIHFLDIDLRIIQYQTVIAPLLLPVIRLSVNWQQTIWHLILLMTHLCMDEKILTISIILHELFLQNADINLSICPWEH